MKRNVLLVAWVVVAAIVVATMGRGAEEKKTATRGVEHVVVCWLKNHGDIDARQRVVEGTKGLRDIPGVRGVKVGVMLPGDRPVVDSTYDVAMVISFDDRKALGEYVNHPIHQKLVKEVIAPLVEKYRVYDFEAE